MSTQESPTQDDWLRGIMPKGTRVYSIVSRVTKDAVHYVRFFVAFKEGTILEITSWVASKCGYRYKDGEIRQRYADRSGMVAWFSASLYAGDMDALRHVFL